jgi:hypothetical protein
LDQRSNGRHVYPFGSGSGRVESIRRRSLRGGFGVVIPHLLEIGIGILEPRPWEDPVKVGMSELCHITTGLASAATAKLARILTKKTLRQPESESLFAHAARSLKQETRRQRTSPNGFGEPLTQLLVSV